MSQNDLCLLQIGLPCVTARVKECMLEKIPDTDAKYKVPLYIIDYHHILGIVEISSLLKKLVKETFYKKILTESRCNSLIIRKIL